MKVASSGIIEDKINPMENADMPVQVDILASSCRIGAVAAILSTLAFADGSALPEYRNGKLIIDVEGNAVTARLHLPMAVADPAKLGLPPAEVLKRLRDGETLFSFPSKGACKLESGSAFAVDREGKPITRAGDFGNIHAALQAWLSQTELDHSQGDPHPEIWGAVITLRSLYAPPGYDSPGKEKDNGSDDGADEPSALVGRIPSKRLPEIARNDCSHDAEDCRQHETRRLVAARHDKLSDYAGDKPNDDRPNNTHGPLLSGTR